MIFDLITTHPPTTARSKILSKEGKHLGNVKQVVKSGVVKSVQVKSGQVNSDQVKSGQEFNSGIGQASFRMLFEMCLEGV